MSMGLQRGQVASITFREPLSENDALSASSMPKSTVSRAPAFSDSIIS